jgi:type IV secretion system protein VirD4
LTERILTPPLLEAKQGSTKPDDDWCRLPAPAAGRDARIFDAPGDDSAGDPANAGIRREPELPDHEEIAPERAIPPPEFGFVEDEPDDDAARARALRRQVRGLARQAAMDPGDGIEL